MRNLLGQNDRILRRDQPVFFASQDQAWDTDFRQATVCIMSLYGRHLVDHTMLRGGWNVPVPANRTHGKAHDQKPMIKIKGSPLPCSS